MPTRGHAGRRAGAGPDGAPAEQSRRGRRTVGRAVGRPDSEGRREVTAVIAAILIVISAVIAALAYFAARVFPAEAGE